MAYIVYKAENICNSTAGKKKQLNTWISFMTILVLIFGWMTNKILGDNILALMPTPSPSHHIWNRALILALASRGHHITILTADAEKELHPNYTEILIEGAYDRIEEAGFNYETMSTYSNIKNSLTWFSWGEDACNYALGTKGAKKLLQLKGKKHFDLIIIDDTVEQCFLSFVSVFNFPPTLTISAYVSPPWANINVGNPQMLAYTSTYLLPYSDKMTFMERMNNFIIHNVVILYYTYYHLPAMDNIARKHLGENIVVPSEILKEHISLAMVNTHFSLDYPRPNVPAMIQVGGMQVTPARKLPKDIQKFLDEAKHGAIFFSLGTNVRSDKMSNEKLKAFLDAFSELPQRVLWKFESDSLPKLPKNVMVNKWLPQNDILGHPNIHLFLSHAGMLSIHEAMYHGVPIVGMPFIADQHANIFKLLSHGVAVKLAYINVTKESVLEAIHEVLHNPSYKENMKKVSVIFRDQPETPLEKAIYWTEYVLRHKGAKHLRARSVDMPLYQYLLLDVIAVLLIGVISVIILLLFILKTIYRFAFPRNNKKKTQ
ncbi:hypothetical protein L9F63_012943, partial [Diploptera punctata]